MGQGPRLRAQLAAREVKNARCVVYMIDSTDKQQIRDAAEQIYDLLTSRGSRVAQLTLHRAFG